MTGVRAALRLARREALRAKGRSALVVAMITVPVAAMSFLAVAWDTFEITPEQQADRQMGTAAAVVSWPREDPVRQLPDHLVSFPADTDSTESTGDPAGGRPAAEPTEERLLALLPTGTRVLRDETGSLSVHTAAGIGTIAARRLDYDDPLARGILTPKSGRAPSAADEAALTQEAVRRLGADVGGTVRLADGSRTLRVVGIVENPADLAATTIVLPTTAPPVAEGRESVHWLVATPEPVTWAQVKQLNTHGLVAVSRHVLLSPPGEAERYPINARIGGGGGPPAEVLTLVAGFAILEVVLLAGPAFAVGARRRRRDLALVAASGGTPAQVRRIVLADGVVLGAVAAVLGSGLGIAAAAVTLPLLEDLEGIRTDGLRVFAMPQIILIGVAVLAGVLAALVPAWMSARQDVVAALSGLRGITRTRRRWPVIGLGLIAAGVGLGVYGALQVDQTVILGSVIIVELGLVLCTPALVGLVARFGRLLPVAPRIALRDASRNRTAAAPAISAVMAAVVGSIVISIVFIAETGRNAAERSARPGEVVVYGGGETPTGLTALPPDAVETVRRIMPVDAIAQVGQPSCDDRHCFVYPKVPDDRDCPYTMARLRREPTAEEQRAARADRRCDGIRETRTYFAVFGSDRGMTVVIDETAAGTVVSVPPEDRDQVTSALRGGAVVVDDARYLENGRVTLGVAGVATDGERTVSAPGFVLPHGASAPIAMMTAATARSLGFGERPMVTVATTTRMPTVEEQDRLQAALGSGYSVEVERGSAPDTGTLLILAVVAGIIALGTAASATGLAAADGRADLATLAAVGASPRLRRMLALSQSGVIAGLGSLLGVLAGMGVATTVLSALNQRFAQTWPAPAALPISVPWLNVGIALVAVPVVAMLGAGLLTRSRLPIERRR